MLRQFRYSMSARRSKARDPQAEATRWFSRLRRWSLLEDRIASGSILSASTGFFTGMLLARPRQAEADVAVVRPADDAAGQRPASPDAGSPVLSNSLPVAAPLVRASWADQLESVTLSNPAKGLLRL
jgi:hypothetical protein